MMISKFFRIFLKRARHLPAKNSSGIALILAISALSLMTYLAMEIMYETSIEYIINSQNLHRIRAHYAAKSGLEVGLLRIKIFQQLQPMLKNLGGTTPLGDVADLVWKLPFSWPIQVPEEMNGVDKDILLEAGKESLMEGKYKVLIELEGTKIDINDLWSPSKGMREITKRQLKNIFDLKVKDDRDFYKKYATQRFDELINNIADYISDKRDSQNGGSKQDGYEDFKSPDFPPNRAFITLDELRLVKGMNDDFFNLLQPAITVYGMRAINPNKAPAEVLKSLDPSMTDEIVQEVVKRRSNPELGGPFKKTDKPESPDSFWTFLENNGARLAEETKKIPLVFDDYYNFRITSYGEASTAKSTLVAIVVDLAKQAKQVSTYVKEEAAAAAGTNGQTPATPPPPATGSQPQGQQGADNSNAPSKGQPRIVYWQEI